MKHLTVRKLRKLLKGMPDDMPIAVMVTDHSEPRCRHMYAHTDGWAQVLTDGPRGCATLWVDTTDIVTAGE